MSEYPHTSAPWRVEFFDDRKAAIIRALDSICAMRKSGDYLQEEFEANARLIAASADMYEALDEIALLVSYIVTHVQGARATEDIENGPHIVAPSLQEVGQIILKIGSVARTAMQKAENPLQAAGGEG